MKSLLYKDLVNLRQQLRFYVVFLAVYLIIGIRQQNFAVLGGVMSIFSVMLPITAYSYDERSGWDKYALTMPFRIKDLILSKYVLAFLGVLISALSVSVLNIAARIDLKEALGIAGAYLALGLFVMDLILPIIFRFGVEKGRVFMILVFLLPTAILLFTDTSSVSAGTVEALLLLSPIVGMLLVPVSVGLSIRCYRKKNFDETIQ